jgi:serine/threonine-protein kinase
VGPPLGIVPRRAPHGPHGRIDSRGQPSPILHRDVTPGNVLLDRSGFVKLGDFGLARATDRERLTRPNIVKGKAAYLAPEIVRGEPPSPQSDLFAVGIVLYEALARTRLFKGGNEVESALLVREARVPMLAVHRPTIPLRLTQAVHRALARDTARRFGSALEMLEELRGLLRVLPTSTDALFLARSFAAADDRRRVAAEADSPGST